MTQLSRFKLSLTQKDFDSAIISSELNQRYLCDFPFTDGYILVTQEKSYIITDFRYEEAMKKAVNDFEILCPKSSRIDCIVELLSAYGAKCTAVEEDSISLGEFNIFSKKLENITTLKEGASKLLLTQRAKKLDYEIERIISAQHITDLTFNHIVDFIAQNKNNLTERDVALEIDYFMQKNGADSPAFETIAISGTATSLPHGVPRNEKLQRGFLTMDFGAKYKGYCSDMTRTIVIGSANDELKKVYNTVLLAQQTALDNICGCMPCKEADAYARNVIENAGYGKAFGHSLGHGVGLFIHEKPNLSPYADPNILLTAGNVVTVEPGIYLEGKFGCRIEDLIFIETDGSVRNLTDSTKDLIEII